MLGTMSTTLEIYKTSFELSFKKINKNLTPKRGLQNSLSSSFTLLILAFNKEAKKEREVEGTTPRNSPHTSVAPINCGKTCEMLGGPWNWPPVPVGDSAPERRKPRT